MRRARRIRCENEAAFESQRRPALQVQEKQKQIELEKKVQTKDEVLAELVAEHVGLKNVWSAA